MEIIFGIIIAVVVFYFIMVLFFKLCNLSEKVTFFFMCVATIGLIVSSFAMPSDLKSPTVDEQTLIWALVQGFCIYLSYVTNYACIALDREEYVETTSYYNELTDKVHTESHIASKNGVWGIIGLGLFIAVSLVSLNYGVLFHIFGENSNAIALGIIGCICLIRTVYVFIRDLRRAYRRNHHQDYY